MIKKTIPFILVLMLAFVGACSNEDAMPQVDSELTGRTITFTASMPDEDGPSTRISAEEAIDGTIGLKWNTDDKIDLLFVQGDNKIHKTTNVTNITEGGKKGSFTIVIPGDIRDGEAFDLYGVYGGGAVSTTNPEQIALPAIDGTTLTQDNVGKNIMLRFATTVDATGAMGPVNFQHVGFLFTAKIKVTAGTVNDITGVQLVGTDAGNEAWAYNASANFIDMQTGDFTTNGTGTNAVSLLNVERDATNDILTARNWFPATATLWPALNLKVNETETLNPKSPNTPLVGKAYYLYATYDGTNLVFTNKDFNVPVVPGDGTKEKPYSVAEAISDVYVDGIVVKDKWIKGYIVGWQKGVGSYEFSTTDGTYGSTTNIIIADNPEEKNGNNVIPVQLKTAAGSLNLKDNPGMYKKQVLLKGDLEAYFSQAGLKEVTDYTIPPAGPFFEADKETVVFGSSLELTETIAISTNDTQAWTATTDAGWLTVTPASRTGSGNVTLTATENTDTEAGRTATVTLTAIDNAALTPIVIDVTQDKFVPLINIDPTAINFATTSGDKILTVDANTDWTASVTIVDGEAGWLTITPTTGSDGETTITATATENTTFAVRNATINITDGAGISIDVNVTQEAVIPFVDFIPTFLSFEQAGGTEIIDVTANITWTAGVNAEATSWLTLTSTTETITVVATENTLDAPRSATITITGGKGVTKTIEVTQAGAVAVERDGLTKATAYLAADIADNQGQKDVWVRSFIVGSDNGGLKIGATGNSASGTNIVISDNKEASTEAEIVRVALPAGAGRTELNLKDNPGMLKAEVYLKGNLVAYFSKPGLKDVKVYEVISLNQ